MENMNVKALIKLIGINENTLRGWERRYGAVTPSRGEDGRRLYSAKDVERIKVLWALVKQGHSIGLIANLPTTKLKKMLSPAVAEQETQELKTSPQKNYLDDIIEALEKFNMESLNLSLQQARFALSSKDVIFKLVTPLMHKVGNLVSENRINIAQEHVLSALLRDYLGALHQSLSPYDFSNRGWGKNIILTTREGDIHEFGILLSSIICNLNRYKTYYLGPHMPIDDLCEACVQFKVDIMVLGVMKLPKEREIITAMDFIKELDKRLPKRISFIMGGSQFIDLSKISSERKMILISNLEELDHYLEKNA
jgi:DNA-binding transcriptional MerR regulator